MRHRYRGLPSTNSLVSAPYSTGDASRETARKRRQEGVDYTIKTFPSMHRLSSRHVLQRKESKGGKEKKRGKKKKVKVAGNPCYLSLEPRKRRFGERR